MYAKNVTKVSNNEVAINDNNLAISQLHIMLFHNNLKSGFSFYFVVFFCVDLGGTGQSADKMPRGSRSSRYVGAPLISVTRINRSNVCS